MLGILDAELFPNDCEVLEMSPHNQFVYLIMKNGNTSLRREQHLRGLNLFKNEQIKNLEFVDVYIRNPKNRYISGVNTYLQHLKRDYPELDYHTAFWFAKKYKFLNRHYLPQFHWIFNLSKFLNPTAKIRLRDFETMSTITNINFGAYITPPTREFVQKLFEDNNEIEFWLYVDQILLDLAGNEMTWQEIVAHYQTYHPNVMNVLSSA